MKKLLLLLVSQCFLFSIAAAQDLPLEYYVPESQPTFHYPTSGVANVFVPKVLTQEVESRFYPGIKTFRLKNPLPSIQDVRAACTADNCPRVQLIEYDAYGPGGRECQQGQIALGRAFSSAQSPKTVCGDRCTSGCCFPKRWKFVEEVGWACEWPFCDEAAFLAEKVGAPATTACNTSTEYCGYEIGVCPAPEGVESLPPHYQLQLAQDSHPDSEYWYQGFGCVDASAGATILPATNEIPWDHVDVIDSVKPLCCGDGEELEIDKEQSCPEECQNDCKDAEGFDGKVGEKICNEQIPNGCGLSNQQLSDLGPGMKCQGSTIVPDTGSRASEDICERIFKCALTGYCPPGVVKPVAGRSCDTPPAGCSKEDFYDYACPSPCFWDDSAVRGVGGGSSGEGGAGIKLCWWHTLGNLKALCVCPGVGLHGAGGGQGRFDGGPGQPDPAGPPLPKPTNSPAPSASSSPSPSATVSSGSGTPRRRRTAPSTY